MAVGSLQQHRQVIGANEIMSSSARGGGKKKKKLETNLDPRVVESGSHGTLETIHFPAKESLLRKGLSEREGDSCARVGTSGVVLVLIIHQCRDLRF